MASKSKHTKPPQWWKHLKDWKKVFWHRERRNIAKELYQYKNNDLSKGDA